jgi:hypothetical protein
MNVQLFTKELADIENPVIQRLVKFAQSKKKYEKDFAKSIGIPPGTFANYKAKNRLPRLEVLQLAKKRYPELSLEWLIGGVGEMELEPVHDTEAITLREGNVHYGKMAMVRDILAPYYEPDGRVEIVQGNGLVPAFSEGDVCFGRAVEIKEIEAESAWCIVEHPVHGHLIRKMEVYDRDVRLNSESKLPPIELPKSDLKGVFKIERVLKWWKEAIFLM